MDYIEFDAHMSNDGTIPVPDKYRKNLAQKQLLHVKVMPQQLRRPRREGEDAIQYYLDNPIIIPNFKPPTREENYEGR